jgi:hypothetical protein
MPRVRRSNAWRVSERANQSATEASGPTNAMSWPSWPTVAEAVVSFAVASHHVMIEAAFLVRNHPLKPLSSSNEYR